LDERTSVVLVPVDVTAEFSEADFDEVSIVPKQPRRRLLLHFDDSNSKD